MKKAGVVILGLGLFMTLYTGYTYVTKERVVDLGNLEITMENEHSIEWEPYVGMAVMVLGGALLAFDRKKPSAA